MQPIKHFDKQPTPSTMLPIKSRSVTDEERAILKDALSELQCSLVIAVMIWLLVWVLKGTSF